MTHASPCYQWLAANAINYGLPQPAERALALVGHRPLRTPPGQPRELMRRCIAASFSWNAGWLMDHTWGSSSRSTAAA